MALKSKDKSVQAKMRIAEQSKKAVKYAVQQNQPEVKAFTETIKQNLSQPAYNKWEKHLELQSSIIRQDMKGYYAAVDKISPPGINTREKEELKKFYNKMHGHETPKKLNSEYKIEFSSLLNVVIAKDKKQGKKTHPLIITEANRARSKLNPVEQHKTVKRTRELAKVEGIEDKYLTSTLLGAGFSLAAITAGFLDSGDDVANGKRRGSLRIPEFPPSFYRSSDSPFSIPV